MTVAPVSGHAPAPAGSGPLHGRPARWAVALSVLGVVGLAASVAIYGVAAAVGGTDAVEDNWVAYLVGSLALAALLGSLVAFVLAVVAKVERERWTTLWLPLCAFPAFVLLVVLGELLWWE